MATGRNGHRRHRGPRAGPALRSRPKQRWLPEETLTGKPPGITNDQASVLRKLCRMLGWSYKGHGMTHSEAAAAIREAEAALLSVKAGRDSTRRLPHVMRTSV